MTAARFVIAILLGTLFHHTASACSCSGATDTSFLKSATYVFTAQIVSASLVGPNETGRYEATFAVKDLVKGTPSELHRLWSGPVISSCTMQFTVGTTYLIFAKKDGYVGECTGTRRYLQLHNNDPVRDLRLYLNANPEP